MILLKVRRVPTFAALAAAVGKQLDETSNKVPERLRLLHMVEFFDSKDNYFNVVNYELTELINNNFEGVRDVVRTDISGYKNKRAF